MTIIKIPQEEIIEEDGSVKEILPENVQYAFYEEITEEDPVTGASITRNVEVARHSKNDVLAMINNENQQYARVVDEYNRLTIVHQANLDFINRLLTSLEQE